MSPAVLQESFYCFRKHEGIFFFQFYGVIASSNLKFEVYECFSKMHLNPLLIELDVYVRTKCLFTTSRIASTSDQVKANEVIVVKPKK